MKAGTGRRRPMRILVNRIAYGHRPDKRGERRGRGGWGNPIDVIRGWFGGYRVHDGNDGLYYAKQRGDSHIYGRVW